LKVAHFQRKPRAGNHSIEELFENIRKHLPAEVQAKVRVSPYLSKGIFSRIKMCFYFRRVQEDVNHVTGDINFVSILLCKNNTLVTIHDIAKVMNSTGIKRFLLWLFWIKLPIHRAKLVSVISEKTRADVIGMLAAHYEKIRVVPNCVSPIFTYQPKIFDVETPKILCLGTKKNKNLIRLFKALEDIPCELTIVGRLDEDQRRALLECGLTYRNVHGLNHQQVKQEYLRADILGMVSLIEGFGMPILEAQAVGRPVVCSNIEPLISVAGGGAILVDPCDSRSIEQGFNVLISDTRKREELISIGLENVKRYTPIHIAGEYCKLYHEIAGLE